MSQPMTRTEFETFLRRHKVFIYVHPYVVEPCDCRDINCHGWRLITTDEGGAMAPGHEGAVEDEPIDEQQPEPEPGPTDPAPGPDGDSRDLTSE